MPWGAGTKASKPSSSHNPSTSWVLQGPALFLKSIGIWAGSNSNVYTPLPPQKKDLFKSTQAWSQWQRHYAETKPRGVTSVSQKTGATEECPVVAGVGGHGGSCPVAGARRS